ncbi:MAG: hypothetical protein JXA01_10730 [Dehalococcoidia bacterium]|nr:hypothetical protein [Dehalococcoidia bacterium]
MNKNREEIEAGKGISYENIIYAAKATIISWDTIAKRWMEFKNGTIGNDKFPGYVIKYQDDKGEWQKLPDGYVSPTSTIRIMPGVFYQVSTPSNIEISRDGKWLDLDNEGNIELQPGNNKLGLYIKELANNRRKYIDFKYLTVVCEEEEKEDTECKCAWDVDYSKLTRVERNIGMHYVDEQQRAQGLYMSWYGGDKSKPLEMGCYKDDKKEGMWTTWWENGVKSKEETWKAGKMDGPFASWDEDGSGNEQGQYTDNKRSGIWTVFNYLKGYDSKWDYDTDTRVEGPENGLWKH